MVESGESRQTFYFKLSVFACVFAGSFQYGYNISSANGPASFIKDTFYPIPANMSRVIWHGDEVTDCTSLDECEVCTTDSPCKLDYKDDSTAEAAKAFDADRGKTVN